MTAPEPTPPTPPAGVPIGTTGPDPTAAPGPTPPGPIAVDPTAAAPTVTPGAPPVPTPGAGELRYLRRSPDRMFGGVAAGVAEYLDTSRVLVRILFVLVAIFAGSGVLIYVLLWLLIPEQGTPNGPLDSVIHRRR